MIIAFNFLGTFWNSEAIHLSEGIYISTKKKLIQAKSDSWDLPFDRTFL